jgi:hypothetical protein
MLPGHEVSFSRLKIEVGVEERMVSDLRLQQHRERGVVLALEGGLQRHGSTAMVGESRGRRSSRYAKYPAATTSYVRQNGGHHDGTPGLAIS